MKTVIAALVVSLSVFAAQAQSYIWNMTSVKSEKDEVVGHIYHIYSKGTSTILNSGGTYTVGLRFVCSLKKNELGPVMTIFWNGPLMMGSSTSELVASVDGKPIVSGRWYHEGPLVYTKATEAETLISALKRGRVVSFSWVGDHNSKYAVAFDLKNFDLTDFNTTCKTRL